MSVQLIDLNKYKSGLTDIRYHLWGMSEKEHTGGRVRVWGISLQNPKSIWFQAVSWGYYYFYFTCHPLCLLSLDTLPSVPKENKQKKEYCPLFQTSELRRWPVLWHGEGVPNRDRYATKWKRATLKCCYTSNLWPTGWHSTGLYTDTHSKLKRAMWNRKVGQ